MISRKPENIIKNNKGETLVEVMVAFMVLLIVLAMFSGVINSGSAAIMNSIDIRRTSDNEYIELRKTLAKEARESTPQAYTSAPGSMGSGRTGTIKSITIQDVSGNDIPITAYQYRSGDTIYWVFR